MATLVKAKRWGRGIAVVIPNRFARMRRIVVGTVLDLETIKTVKPRQRRYKLSELMARFKPKHRHGEWQIGGPVGKEIW